MKYLVYKTTNNINGKIYIGCHKTENVDDGYLGSGKILKRAILKYGVENFTRQILAEFDNPDDMFEMESQLVTEDFVTDDSNYNLKVGGEGGFDYINSNIYDILSDEERSNRARRGREATNALGNHIKGSQKHHRMMKEDPDYRAYVLCRLRRSKEGKPGSFLGKHHTDESKRKIGVVNSQKQKGAGNSNYGKCWIHNVELKQNKSIPKDHLEQWIKDGWVKGRKIKF